jgi:hypothetical protein
MIPVFFAFSYFILWAADARMVTGEAAKCPWQFPKWFGCVLANHESLAGSLIAVGGGLLAALIAWRGIMDQIASNRSSIESQIKSDREIARIADRAYVIGGPGARWFDDDKNEIGIVSTAMNTGKTPAFPKKVYWGICKKDDWPTVEKSWPKVPRQDCQDWAEVLLPLGPRDGYLIGFTRTPVPNDGKDYVCYRTIIYATVFGDEVTTSWKHLVQTIREEKGGKVGRRLKTDPLPGGYGSEWESSTRSITQTAASKH